MRIRIATGPFDELPDTNPNMTFSFTYSHVLRIKYQVQYCRPIATRFFCVENVYLRSVPCVQLPLTTVWHQTTILVHTRCVRNTIVKSIGMLQAAVFCACASVIVSCAPNNCCWFRSSFRDCGIVLSTVGLASALSHDSPSPDRPNRKLRSSILLGI